MLLRARVLLYEFINVATVVMLKRHEGYLLVCTYVLDL
jgi:hypothetical protein